MQRHTESIRRQWTLEEDSLKRVQKMVLKNPPANAGDLKDVAQSLGQENPLEEGMATRSSILAWRI